MTLPSQIIYYYEPLPGGRAQLYRDVIVFGELRSELSGKIGSPAPLATVRKFERTITLDPTTPDAVINKLAPSTDIADLGDLLLLDSLTQPDAP